MPVDFDSHRRDAELEDVQFLLTHGVPLTDACTRVGVTVDCIEKRLERATPGATLR